MIEAYKRMREAMIADAWKHRSDENGLREHYEKEVDDRINTMSVTEFMREVEAYA